MASGVYPTHRGDGIPFSESTRRGDSQRAAWGKAKRKLKVRGGCIQLKGDWAWLAQAFDFITWRGDGEEKLCCPKCRCTKAENKEIGRNAKWRTQINMDA